MTCRLIPVLTYLSNGNCWTELNQAFADQNLSNLRDYLPRVGIFLFFFLDQLVLPRSHWSTPSAHSGRPPTAGWVQQPGELDLQERVWLGACESAVTLQSSASPVSLTHPSRVYSRSPLACARSVCRLGSDLSGFERLHHRAAERPFDHPRGKCELRSRSICQG